jgi:formylglycine-generating enzyme required for sulfatase activity
LDAGKDIAMSRIFLSHSSSNNAEALYAIVLALSAVICVAGINYNRWAPVATAAVFRFVNLTKDLTKSGTVFQDCSACPQMVVIPAGSFMMGSPETDKDARDDERPQHKVTIAKPFAVSRFEVTFAEWNTCIDAGGCEHRPSAWLQPHGRLALRQSHRPGHPGLGQGARPVINVSWDDITKQYLPWLNRVTGQAYRLLTEAEWEYAARAGKTTRYSWGDDPGENNANCNGCKSQWDYEQPAPVGSFKPNDFGLYDMHGNVWEWVQDCYNEKAYATAPRDGSAAPDEPNCNRVLRGTSWMGNPRSMRAAFRNGIHADYRFNGYGFRVARDLPAARTN